MVDDFGSFNDKNGYRG